MNENKLSIYIKIFLCFLIHINFCEGDENIYKSSSNVYTNTIEFKNVKFKVLKEGRIMKTSSKIRIPYPPGIKYLFKNWQLPLV